MVEKVQTNSLEAQQGINYKKEADKTLKHLLEDEYALDHDKDLQACMEKTVQRAQFSTHLQHVGGRTSADERIKPKLTYPIALGPITIPSGTPMHFYSKTSGIKNDEGGSEFYINYSRTSFDALVYEGEAITESLKKFVSEFAHQKSLTIDTKQIQRVKAEVIIQDLYGANHSITVTEKGKEHLNRPQNLEEVLVRYTIVTADGREYKVNNRQYYSHKIPKPRSVDLYNARISGNEVGAIGNEVKQPMMEYRSGLLELMEQQADSNYSGKVANQERVVKNYFKPMYHLVEKEDIDGVTHRIDNVQKSINVTKAGIEVNDPWWQEALKAFSGNPTGILDKSKVVGFLGYLLSAYPLLKGKYSLIDKDIKADEFVEKWQGMGKFPEANAQFSGLILREAVPLVLYQSNAGNLYYGGINAGERKTDTRTGIPLLQRQSMALTATSLKHIIAQVFSWYVTVRTVEEKNHRNEVNSLLLRHGLTPSQTIGNPIQYFNDLCISNVFESQFVKTYDSSSNPVIKGNDGGSIVRLHEKNGYKLGVNFKGKYFTLSQNDSGFQLDESGRTYLLASSAEDRSAISAFLTVIKKQMEAYRADYEHTVINREVRN